MHDPVFARDPYPTYERLRDECPVMHVDECFREYGKGGYWLLTRYDDVDTAAVNPETFSSSVPGVTAIPMVRLQERGGGDLVGDFAVPLSLRTLSEFLSLPATDEPLWLGWVTRLFHSARELDDARRATAEFHDYIDTLVTERAATPREDFISMLIGSEVEVHRLTPEGVRAFCVVVMVAGHETSPSAMAVALERLAQNRAERNRLGDQPDLAVSALEEFVRYSTPIQTFGRNATRDVELRGQMIEAGAVVALSYGSASRDPAMFRDPTRWCSTDGPIVTWDSVRGPHSCLGAYLARIEMGVLLETFSSLADLSLADDDPPVWAERGDRRGLVRLGGRSLTEIAGA
ncbi:MAG: cytochrome P450 [Haloechinothrix sp.]